MQLRAVGRRCSTARPSVLGDLAQGTTPWATDSWKASLGHLGKPDAVIEILERGFRVPASVIEFAAQLLPSMAPTWRAVSVRDNPGRLEIVRVKGPDCMTGSPNQWPRLCANRVDRVIVPEAAAEDISKALSRNGVEHGLLGANHGDLDHQVDVVPATVAKGLEFDRVIVVEPSPSLRLSLTAHRASTALCRAHPRCLRTTVFHCDDLPVELAS